MNGFRPSRETIGAVRMLLLIVAASFADDDAAFNEWISTNRGHDWYFGDAVAPCGDQFAELDENCIGTFAHNIIGTHAHIGTFAHNIIGTHAHNVIGTHAHKFIGSHPQATQAETRIAHARCGGGSTCGRRSYYVDGWCDGRRRSRALRRDNDTNIIYIYICIHAGTKHLS